MIELSDLNDDSEEDSVTEVLERFQSSKSGHMCHKYHTWQNYLGGAILLISYGFCIPGLFYYDSCIAHTLSGRELAYSAYGLVELLWNAAHNELRQEVNSSLAKIPAALIFIFSIAMPFIKLLATVFGVFVQSEGVLWLVARVSKFQHVDGQIVMLLKCYLQLKPIIYVDLRIGFYLFLFYCILSSAGVQIILSQFVNEERISRTQCSRDIWLPISFTQVLSISIFFFFMAVMIVNPVDPSTGLHIARVNKSMAHVLMDSDAFVAIWLLTTAVLFPCLTYVVLPAVLQFGNRKLIEDLGGRNKLQLLLEYAHDWSLGDVLLLAWTITFLIILSLKWTNPELHPIGGYAMIFYGLSTGFIIYVFQLNACMQDGGQAACDDQGWSLLPNSRSHRKISSRSCLKCCPLQWRWRVAVYALIIVAYGSLAGLVLHMFQCLSKPTPDISSTKSLNQALNISLDTGGDREGLLHHLLFVVMKRGSMGSCSKKGKEGGPPGDLPCMDVPAYHIRETNVDGLIFPEFKAASGGPIYKASVNVEKLFKVRLKVSFVTGLENVRIDYIRFVDLGVSGESSSDRGQKRTRRMQLSLSLVIDPHPLSPAAMSLPVTVRIGPRSTVPCCNPRRVTVTFNLACNRQYPFFSFEIGQKPVIVKIDPPDTLNVRLLPGIVTNFGISHNTIEEKLAEFVAKYANTSVRTSTIPDLVAFYPYSTVSFLDALSFLISSNLPMDSSNYWDFCPDDGETT